MYKCGHHRSNSSIANADSEFDNRYLLVFVNNLQKMLNLRNYGYEKILPNINQTNFYLKGLKYM